jgi:hypothetical protein
MKKLLLAALFLCVPVIACAQEKLSIGLGWPYGSVKYNLSQSFAPELRYATGEGINVYSGRVYWNFYQPQNIKLFTGLEGGQIDFDTLDIKGNGYEGSIFIGGEFFIANRLSLLIDFDPTFISLRSDDIGVDGVEWVMNLAVYFYIF